MTGLARRSMERWQPPVRVDLALLPHQRAAFQECTARNVVVVGGRRSGKTEGAARACLRCCLEDQGSRHLWIDTVHRNIVRYVNRYFLPRLAPLPARAYGWNQGQMTLTVGRSSVDFGSAEKPLNLEGFGYDYLWLNEAGIILWDENFWQTTLSPMFIEGNPRRFMFGTPKGSNMLQQFYDRGQDLARPDWESFRWTSWDNPRVNADLLAEDVAELPENVVRQEYRAEFISDGGFFRGLDDLFTATWETGPSPASTYMAGVDIGRTVDYTVCWVGRLDTRELVHCVRFANLPWPEQQARLKAVYDTFGCRMLVDATGLGQIAVDDLNTVGIPADPFIFTQDSKIELLQRFARDVEQGRVRLAPHAPTLQELRVFQQTARASGKPFLSAPDHLHDDCVMAAALCNWQLPYVQAVRLPRALGAGIARQQEGQPW